MIKNYFVIAIRNLLRHKVFSFINIFGLAAGMSICLLIISMLIEQKSYDQFHENKDRIYRVITHPFPYNNTATSPDLLAEALEEYTTITQTTRLKRGFGGDATYHQTTIPLIGFFAESSLLEVFDFPLKYGNPQLALQEPFSIVLSEEMAEKLFGNENPLGKVLSFEERGLNAFGYSLSAQKGQPYGDFKVTGVFEKTTNKTHIPMDAFMSYATRQGLVQQGIWEKHEEKWSDVHNTYTYVLLKEGQSVEEFSAILDQVAQREYAQLEEAYHPYRFQAQPLTQITPGPFTLNNPMSIQLPRESYYFWGILALLIMVTASFNYTNLSIARSLTRAKEVGIRKVSGAFRYHLFGQFIGESIIIAVLSLGMGILFFQVLKSGFINLWVNQYLEFELAENISIYLYFLVFGIIVGLMSGFYPALYMSRYSPLQVLKNFKLVRPGGLGMRKILITLQFTFSLVFVISALIFYKQLDHYLHMEYGFSKENILNVELQGQEYDKVASQLAQVNAVEDISGSWYVPASGIQIGKEVRIKETAEPLYLNYMAVTPNYFVNHQIPLLAGKTFSLENPLQEIVINQKAVGLLGLNSPQEAIGTTLLVEDTEATAGYRNVVVVGVIRDFQGNLPIEELQPMMLDYDPANIKIANVRILPADIRETMASLEESWQAIDPLHAFEAQFLEDQLNTIIRVFVDILKVFGFLTFLAITIACLGLLGMAVFTAESRVKEVGIRKVMGAETGQLVFLLSKGFLQLLLIAVVIAAPMAYFGNNLWLQNFANHISLHPGTFLSGIAIMLGLGLLVIVSQTLRAAMHNPVKSLRDE